jgi:hypothetical protein
MQLDRYIPEDLILDIKGQDLQSVLVEMLEPICAKHKRLSAKSLLRELISRENALTRMALS